MTIIKNADLSRLGYFQQDVKQEMKDLYFNNDIEKDAVFIDYIRLFRKEPDMQEAIKKSPLVYNSDVKKGLVKVINALRMNALRFCKEITGRDDLTISVRRGFTENEGTKVPGIFIKFNQK